MRTLAAVVAVCAGALLLVVPRFVFPACEYLGRGRMHCTAAAQGEYAVGALLVVAGVWGRLSRTRGGAAAAAALATLLCAAALVVPAWTGYCANPDMACHYGMVPTVRFVAGAAGLVELAALVSLARRPAGEEA